MVERLAEGVWCVDCGQVNAFLLADDDAFTMVDAGTPGDADRLRGAIADVGRSVDDVDRVFLTHYDYDHVGALAALDLDATLYAHEHDAGLLTGARSPPLTNHKGLFQRLASLRLTAPDLAVETVADGDRVGTFEAFHTPGHSPGHLAFVSEALDVGVLGDLVRESDGRLRRSPRVFNYDTTAVERSVVEMAERVPPFAVACVGHGDPLVEGGIDALRRLARELS